MGYWIVPDLSENNVWYMDIANKVSLFYFNSVESLHLVFPEAEEYIANEETLQFEKA